MSHNKNTFEYAMDQAAIEAPRWTKPVTYDPTQQSDRDEMQQLVEKGGAKVQRKVGDIANELFEIDHPDQKRDRGERARYIEPIIAEGDHYGMWHHFSWSNRLVQFAHPDVHWQLLTNRDRELISQEELSTLRHKTIGYVGLSVGSHILEQNSHMAFGDKVLLSDHDILSVPNLNRINAGMPQVGMNKTDVAGIKLSELNPYVEQVHFPEGLTPDNASDFISHKPDFIYEEVDHLPTKVLMRKLAYRVGAVLIMATDAGELSTVDVERYDLGDIRPFLDALTPQEIDMAETGNPSPEETVRLIEQLIGYENISPRLRRSLAQIGITLAGIAQLGTTASVGGGYAAIVGKEIALGSRLSTGRYRISPQEILNLPYRQ